MPKLTKTERQNVRRNVAIIDNSVEMYLLLKSAVGCWPEVFREDQDGEINGADAVDWLCTFIRQAKKTVDKIG